MKKNLIFLSLLFIILMVLSCTSAKNAQRQAEAEKLAKEIEVGQSAFAKLAGKYGLVRDKEATLYLNRMLRVLSVYSERQELLYRIGILNSEQVNAYSLPGGYILITAGTLKSIKTPGALAGILCHELGHVDLKHVLHNVNIQVKPNFWETLARFLAGSRSMITSAMDQINGKIEEVLFVKGYAAADEYQADEYALKLMQELGFSSQDYLDYLLQLSQRDDIAALENLDKTHPPLKQRIAALNEMDIKELPSLPSTEEFNGFKQRIENIKTGE